MRIVSGALRSCEALCQAVPRGETYQAVPERELFETSRMPGQPPCANCPLLTADRTLADCPPLTNRINAVIEHIPWYGFRTQVRLARDSQVSEAAISRLLRGESQPSLVVALQVAGAIARRLGRPVDVGELFSLSGSFPTASVCKLVGCRNCLPECFYDEGETLKPQFRDVRPGQWQLNQPHKSLKSYLMIAGSEGGR